MASLKSVPGQIEEFAFRKNAKDLPVSSGRVAQIFGLHPVFAQQGKVWV